MKTLLLATALLTFALGTVQATEKSGHMTVSATVTTSCSITAAAEYRSLKTVTLDGVVSLSVSCSAEGPAIITFGQAAHVVVTPTLVSARSATSVVAKSPTPSAEGMTATVSF